MKKIIILLGVLSLVLSMMACNKIEEEAAENNGPANVVKLVPMTFSASYSYDGVDDDETTKTVLDGLSIKWKAGDKVAVFDDVDPSTPHEFTANSDGDKTSFTGSVSGGAVKFFAVYPYSAAINCDANDSGDYVGQMNVNIPSVQRPVVGSFDPDAAVMAAFTDATDKAFHFKVPFALAKFTVNYDNVYSVSFSSGKNMTGSLHINLKSNGSIGTGDGTSGDKLKTLTIKNADNTPLTKGATYYAVMRYRIDGNSYTDFTATLGNTDCGYADKTASATVPMARASVNNLGNFSGMTFTHNLYRAYMDGIDLVLGEKTYNKSDYGDATLLASGTALSNATFNKKAKGVYFFESGGSYSNAGELNISTEVIISATSPISPATLTFGSDKTWNLNSGSLVMNGIAFDNKNITDSKQSFLVKNATADFDYLAFFNCNSNNIKKYFLHYHGESLDYVIKQIVFDHCVLGVYSTASPIIVNAGSCTRTNDFEMFTFSNSVLYNTADANTQVQLFNYYPSVSDDLTGRTWKMAAYLRNNIFYNVATNASNIRTYKFKSISVTGNIICCPEYSPSNSMKIFTQRINTEGHGTIVSASDNIAHAAVGTDSKWILADDAFTTNIGITKTLSFESTNPLTTADKATQTFTVAPAYAAYGPQAL